MLEDAVEMKEGLPPCEKALTGRSMVSSSPGLERRV
jgi:hypothetical protein